MNLSLGWKDKSMQEGHYYRSLTRKMIFTVLLVSFAPLMLVSGIIGYWFETSYEDKVIAHVKELVDKHQQNINLFLNEKLSYIRVLANSFAMEQLTDEAFLNHKLTALQQAYGGVFVDLGVVNQEGVQVAYAGMFKLEKADYSHANWFRWAIERQFFISDVFLGLRRQPHFIVAVRQRWQGQDWIIRATIDFVAFNSLVENIQVGETGSAFILNRQGDFQTTPRPEQAANKQFFLDLLAQKDSENHPAPAVSTGGDYGAILIEDPPFPMPGRLAGEEMIAGEANHGNHAFIYVLTPLKSGEWMLAYQQEKRDAFSDLYNARKIVAVILLIGGLGIIVMAVALSRRMVHRIEEADQEKEMMNEQVIEAGKLASVGELAAGIAHEINNPVAVMVEEAGWMEDLLQDCEFKEGESIQEFRRALDQIRIQGARCKEITHKLLSFARKTDPNIREVQLNDLIEEVVGISEQKARYSNVKINLSLTPDLPLIHASPSEIQQVLLNLINNAVDAIGAKGGTIDVTSRIENSNVVVDVADTGHGIPKTIMGRIFDPFFTTKPVGKGTGLGLSICYGIIQKMGGEISVNSAVGVGTTFHIRIPKAKIQ